MRAVDIRGRRNVSFCSGSVLRETKYRRNREARERRRRLLCSCAITFTCDFAHDKRRNEKLRREVAFRPTKLIVPAFAGVQGCSRRSNRCGAGRHSIFACAVLFLAVRTNKPLISLTLPVRGEGRHHKPDSQTVFTKYRQRRSGSAAVGYSDLRAGSIGTTVFRYGFARRDVTPSSSGTGYRCNRQVSTDRASISNGPC